MRILKQDILIKNDPRPWLTGCQMGGGKRISNFVLFPLFFFLLNLFEGKVKDSQRSSDTHIVIWHLSIWEEITGDLQDIFISGITLKIMFCDGINIFVPLPDKNILQRLQRSRGKLIGICKTNNPTRRYHFCFYENQTVNNHSTAIHCKNDEEIAALEALYGVYGTHGMKKPWAKSYRNQQQLYAWIGGQ